MTDCELCGYPMVWSDTHRTTWCSVYGRHLERRVNGPTELLMAAAVELHPRRHLKAVG